ncbi:pre-mRNA-splicing factor CLF1 [Fomitopsis serialis]|uniref:pre-mRNA-splicing factor CLF1 n=1 Tax=Fomitopsis serialis TaxID=139415 RepID=UPI0020071EC9|nr:pre-mRNA-splicing factor CLF1 [Neoantrodia serialis]KAH9915734.1 pre-mRNA-splicing factor CLF1 [Neoantrodia serialis]
MQDGGHHARSIKNRAPAAIQVTAEQLLRDAQERQESQFRAPKQLRGRKREEFEKRIRQTRSNIKEWLQYANWEASQGEYARSRSVFERALDVDPRSLKGRNVQHARNLFDRAVTLLPRVDQLWYKYVYLEELLQNVPGARQVFERWMQWEPDDKAWQAYIKMETRYGELDRASTIYERWIAVRPEPRNWVKWAKFEEDRTKLDKAREVFQTALEFFGDGEEEVEKAQAVFSAFAKMETRLKEYERARVIYKFALSRVPRTKSAALYAHHRPGKRRIQYEDELAQEGHNYDAWFDTRVGGGRIPRRGDEGATLEESRLPGQKRHWRRYIFLWLNYALFEEIETKVYTTAIRVVPHKQFTFAKLWLMFANFEVRQLDLPAARKILGAAIGMCPKEALFKGYIQLELDLREFDRVRTLYEKYIEFDPSNSSAWVKYAELESQLEDFSRTRAIFELGVTQQPLAMPEVLWKAYIDFEVEEGNREGARALYERLVAISGHWKVWIAYAEFEAAPIPVARELREEREEEEEEEETEMAPGDVERARRVFERGYADLRKQGLKDERAALLEVWKTFEEKNGTPEDVQQVQSKIPIVSARRVKANDGQEELVWDMVFPDDERESNPTSFQFLQMAHQWKKKQAEKAKTSQPEGALQSPGAPSAPSFTRASAATTQEQDTDMRDASSDVASSHGGD